MGLISRVSSRTYRDRERAFVANEEKCVKHSTKSITRSMTQVTLIIKCADSKEIHLTKLDKHKLSEKLHYFDGFLNFNKNSGEIEIDWDYGEELKEMIEFLLDGGIRSINTVVTFGNVVTMLYTSTYFMAAEFFDQCVEFLQENLKKLPLSFQKRLIDEILEI